MPLSLTTRGWVRTETARTHFWLWEKNTKNQTSTVGNIPLTDAQTAELHQHSLSLKSIHNCYEAFIVSMPIKKFCSVLCPLPCPATLSLWKTQWEGWRAYLGFNSHLQHVPGADFFLHYSHFNHISMRWKRADWVFLRLCRKGGSFCSHSLQRIPTSWAGEDKHEKMQLLISNSDQTVLNTHVKCRLFWI